MITLDKAQEAIEASHKKAEELRTKITTTIVDEHGTLIAANRMDGAITISPEFAYAKAYTSATIGLPTGDIANYSGEGKPYFGTTSAFGGKLMVIAGGIPVKIGEKLVGGIGVGGSLDVKQDEECAKAAAEVLSK